MITIAFLAAAAAATVVRAILREKLDRSFPVGTFTVNVAGSFALGLIATTSGDTALVIGTGALGSLTTYSTFAAQVIDDRQWLYVPITIVACVAAASLGWTIG